ncbi:BED-type domain-containing protein [Aphelenchoides besseyi]|nr:BED-type domain-containing protein [Aphelenchoides besseyi]KAI6199530.1 BED-type domain-containing protein [Aphelenchoides besseyi]
MAVADEMETDVQETSKKNVVKPNSSVEKSTDKINTYNLLLSQAVKANDWSEISGLMQKIWEDGESTAKRVAAQLNVADIVPLLRITAAVMREERLKESPKHIRLTNQWIKFTTQILQSQSAYLSMLDNLDEELNDLMDYVRQRASHMQKLLQLEAKIAWIAEHAEERKKPLQYANQKAQVVFEDTDEKEEDEPMDGISFNDKSEE